jgi:uncharacterized protein YjbJ (UPF0337 family)
MRVMGWLKEKAGRAKGDRGMAQEGRRDQIKDDLKKSGEKVKDATKKM